jgi:transitional endoplasmic reticulum ATPase
LYSSHIFDSPKGILLFGPPGTGKSAITKAFCEESGMVFVTAPMAAGDLKKGIVGDSEKTINALADRARLIPWDLCVCLIDEIDSLVPDRNSAGSSTGACDLLSVILAIQDGSKITKNLKIIASTNLLNKMDAAFLRRMEIQIFLGNPSRSSRSKWVTWKALLCQGASNYKRL